MCILCFFVTGLSQAPSVTKVDPPSWWANHTINPVRLLVRGVNLTGAREDAFRHPMQLYGRLAALLSDLAENGADFAPTTQQVAVHDLLAQRLAEASTRFADLMAKAVPAFVAELRRTPLRDVIGSGAP